LRGTQPVDVDAKGEPKPRFPTVKELLERVAIRGEFPPASDGPRIAELTAEEVAALKGLAVSSLTMSVAIFVVGQLERPIGE